MRFARPTRFLLSLLDRTPAVVARLFHPGGRAARQLGPLVNRLLPAEESIVEVRGGAGAGLRLRIQPRREKFYWTGAYEPHVQDTLRRLLAPGMTFWDVGAHAGFFTAIAARLVGERGHVIAIEPLPANRSRLVATIDLNDLSNVTLLPYAVGAASGQTTLYRHGSSSMWTIVAERGEGAGEHVECRTLGELAESAPRPDVIKIDVEGAELDVIRGGVDFLLEACPKLIVEFSDDEAAAKARALLPGYRVERLGPRQWLLT